MGEDKQVLISDEVDTEPDLPPTNSNNNVIPSKSKRDNPRLSPVPPTRGVYNGTTRSTLSRISTSPLQSFQDWQNHHSNLENTNNVNRRKELNRVHVRVKSFLYEGLPNTFKSIAELWIFHQKLIFSSILTMISATGCLISFPELLDHIATNKGPSDGYSSCLAASTVGTLLIILVSSTLKLFLPTKQLFKPIVSLLTVFKIGFSVGLSVLTLFYAWEDNKVSCNLQDPLLGLVIIFAIITHIVSKWKRLGFRRCFTLITITAGVFVSVNYPLVDHHRCRGHFYSHIAKDNWSWKVHLVWTMAFVVSIWLWVVAIFSLESGIPVQNSEDGVKYEDYNAVNMTVIRIQQVNPITNQVESSVQVEDSQGGGGQESDLSFNRRGRMRSLQKSTRFGPSPYSSVSYLTILNAVQWFHISSWFLIALLFWTEFFPGFGKGSTTMQFLPQTLSEGFFLSFIQPSFWWLILSIFVFSQSFTYLLVIVRSPMIAVSIASLGFPLLGMWWSIFQIQNNYFVYMPVFTGELLCSLLGFPIILVGIYYLLKLDVFYGQSSSQNNRRNSPPQILAM